MFLEVSSRPIGACGLKRNMRDARKDLLLVAPHRGVWIETRWYSNRKPKRKVAPHRGVWIETNIFADCFLVHLVAPHRGVWIETTVVCQLWRKYLSRPIGACGLKL